MPIPIVPKSTDQPGVQPTPQELLQAELALNANNGILYAKMADGTVLPVRARPLGGYPAGDPGTFDGGCCPPVVTDSGEVIPGVVGQPAPGTFQITSIGCAVGGSSCLWNVTFYQPRGFWGLFHVQGEVRQPVTGEVMWAFVAQDLWVNWDSGTERQFAISTLAPWRDTDQFGAVLWSPSSPSSGWQPTGRYRVAAGGMVDRVLPTATAEYTFAGPGTVPANCSCDPPPPPDYGSWVVVDNGETTRYDCVGGACVANPGRQYAVRWQFVPADGVTSFAAEADATAAANALTTQGGQYATQAACVSACVSGAWVVTASGNVTRYRCTGGNCNSANSQQYSTYTVAFSAGTSVTGPVSNGGSFATQQEANAWVNNQTVAMLAAHPYATLADCQTALGVGGACASVKNKCVTTVTNGVTTYSCVGVADADVPAALASGASLFPTAADCQQYCGAPAGSPFLLEKCSSNESYHATEAAQQLSQAQTCAQDMVERGWSSVTVTRAVQASTFTCGGATGPVVSLAGRCPGTIDYEDVGPQRTLLRYRATGSTGWYEDSFRATRCVPNPAP